MTDILYSRTTFRVVALHDQDRKAAAEVAELLAGGKTEFTPTTDPDTRRIMAIARLARHLWRLFGHDRDWGRLAPTPLCYYDSWRIPPDEAETARIPDADHWRVIRERIAHAMRLKEQKDKAGTR